MKEPDYDSINNSILNKYLDAQELACEVSNCCGEPMLPETDICSSCREYAAPITLAEFQAEEYENAMCDAADSTRELKDDD